MLVMMMMGDRFGDGLLVLQYYSRVSKICLRTVFFILSLTVSRHIFINICHICVFTYVYKYLVITTVRNCKFATPY